MIRTFTPEPTRRQRNRARKLAEYLDHALAIVSEKGLDGLTMPGLAERADTGVGSLYRYFTGKDAVIAALQVRAVQAYGEHLAAVLDDGPPLVALRRVSATWADFRHQQPELFSLADGSLSDPRQLLNDEQASEVAAALAPSLAAVSRLIDRAVDQGELAPGDTTLRTHSLWAAMHGSEHFRKREGRHGPSADGLRAELIEALLGYWARPSSSTG